MAAPDILTISPSVLYFGTPVVLVGTASHDGKTNITPISSAWALGPNIVIGLGTTGQALRNIRETGECTLNLPSADLWSKVEAIARTTGCFPVPSDKASMGYTYCADKFALGDFAPLPSENVKPPRIGDCPLQLECRLSGGDLKAALFRRPGCGDLASSSRLCGKSCVTFPPLRGWPRFEQDGNHTGSRDYFRQTLRACDTRMFRCRSKHEGRS
ncbi:flavin reductase family protein [Gluconacetobacter asukensis]|uniref:Flavin reductase family protein n=1 Tax=Gluconacetobacter asukensis TaxID=1017181 RepID=A0A7W4IZ18_9PROT|nr:flavin reductase family protein [Gluconacetobacter asukensis]MBB2171679.1 flavin reductase family protein [Gluconacetobacter asukensis]